MPTVDDALTWATPSYLAQQNQQVAVPASPVGAVAPVPVATARPAVGSAPTDAQFREWLLGSPRYKQGIETLQGGYDTSIQRMNEMQALEAKLQRGATYTPITIPGSYYEQIALAKERAAHENELKRRAIPEYMAARGMLSSGQTGFELGEQQYGYETLLKDIDLQRKSREEETAQANARGAASAAQQNANLAVQRQLELKQDEYRRQDLERGLAQDKLKLFNDVAVYYKMLWWDETTGQYVGQAFGG